MGLSINQVSGYTIAEFLTLTLTLADGSYALIAGKTTRGDGSGGLYYFDGAATDTPDGFLILRQTIHAATAGRWFRVTIPTDWNVTDPQSMAYVVNKPVTGGTVTSVGLSSSDFTISGTPVTAAGSITANLPTTGVSAGTYQGVTVTTKGLVTAGTNPVVTAVAAGARNFNQAYQVSATKLVDVRMSAQMACVLSLTAGGSGEIFLEYSADGSTNWLLAGKIAGSNTGSLTIGLNTTQITGSQLSTLLPIGYYWRLRTNNVTGTPTYTMTGGVEIVY